MMLFAADLGQDGYAIVCVLVVALILLWGYYR